MSYLLSFRDERRSVGGAVVPGKLKDMHKGQVHSPSPKSLWAGQKVLFGVHGFDVNRDEGKNNCLGIDEFLSQTPNLDFMPDVFVGVQWPGDHSWMWKAGYITEAKDAQMAAKHFCDFIKAYVSPAAELYFLSHSLGARVVMTTVKKLVAGTQPKSRAPKVYQMCLMAGAIDHDSLSLPGSKGYRSATLASDRVTAVVSKEDGALGLVYRAGDLGQWLFGPSEERWGKALGRHGIAKGPEAPHWDLEMQPKGKCFRHLNADEVDHGDYLPEGPASPPPSSKSERNLKLAMSALAGKTDLTY